MATQQRILLILDVDETLIHATGRLLGNPDFTAGSYNVYRRPHLEEFLKTCSEYYDLAIWSSGGSDYLQAVVNNIMPPNIQPVFIWCRDRCIRRVNPETQDECFLKDLKKVKRQGFDLDRVLIVEDTAEKVQRNYGNAVYVTSYVGQADDKDLLLLGQYLASIHLVENVRKLEKRGWRGQQVSESGESHHEPIYTNRQDWKRSTRWKFSCSVMPEIGRPQPAPAVARPTACCYPLAAGY